MFERPQGRAYAPDFWITPSRVHVRLAKVLPRHVVQIVQHVEIYGTNEEKNRAYLHLAEMFVGTAKECSSVGELSSGQVMQSFLSENLVATEDEVMWCASKWIAMNPQALNEEIAGLYSSIRVERLKRMDLMQKLISSEARPSSILRNSARLCLHHLHSEVSLTSIAKYVYADPESTKFFIRVEDSFAGHKTYFSWGNFEMSAIICAKRTVLIISIERRRIPGHGSLLQQIQGTKFDILIVETSLVQKHYAEPKWEMRTFDFQEGCSTMHTVLPTSTLNMSDRSFWVFVSEHKAEDSTTLNFRNGKCTSCAKRKRPDRPSRNLFCRCSDYS